MTTQAARSYGVGSRSRFQSVSVVMRPGDSTKLFGMAGMAGVLPTPLGHACHELPRRTVFNIFSNLWVTTALTRSHPLSDCHMLIISTLYSRSARPGSPVCARFYRALVVTATACGTGGRTHDSYCSDLRLSSFGCRVAKWRISMRKYKYARERLMKMSRMHSNRHGRKKGQHQAVRNHRVPRGLGCHFPVRRGRGEASFK